MTNNVEIIYEWKWLCLDRGDSYYLSENNDYAEVFDIRMLTRAKEDGKYGLCEYFKRHGAIDDDWDAEVRCMELNYWRLKLNFIL